MKLTCEKQATRQRWRRRRWRRRRQWRSEQLQPIAWGGGQESVGQAGWNGRCTGSGGALRPPQHLDASEHRRRHRWRCGRHRPPLLSQWKVDGPRNYVRRFCRSVAIHCSFINLNWKRSPVPSSLMPLPWMTSLISWSSYPIFPADVGWRTTSIQSSADICMVRSVSTVTDWESTANVVLFINKKAKWHRHLILTGSHIAPVGTAIASTIVIQFSRWIQPKSSLMKSLCVMSLWSSQTHFTVTSLAA